MRQLSLLLLALAASAQEVRIVDCQVSAAGDRQLLLRGAIEADASPPRWIGVWFQVRLGDGTALDPEVLVKWSDLFTPDPQSKPTRWSDCSMLLGYEKLEACKNLPKGAHSLLRFACDPWGAQENKWLANGWPLSCPVFVTTDAQGRIVKADPFYTRPHDAPRCRTHETKPARRITLDLKHLKLRPGVELGRCVGAKHTIYDLLVWTDPQNPQWPDRRQAGTDWLERGFFFEPLATADAAKELVLLAHRGRPLVASREAYAALKTGHEKRREQIAPTAFGCEAEAVDDLGWRVRLLVVEDGEVWQYDNNVARDGRLYIVKTQCLVGWHIDTPPGTPLVPNVVRLRTEVAALPVLEEEMDGYLAPEEWPDHVK